MDALALYVFVVSMLIYGYLFLLACEQCFCGCLEGMLDRLEGMPDRLERPNLNPRPKPKAQPTPKPKPQPKAKAMAIVAIEPTPPELTGFEAPASALSSDEDGS